MTGRRAPNPPWKHIYGVDRKYTRRVDRARERHEARIDVITDGIVERYGNALEALGKS